MQFIGNVTTNIFFLHRNYIHAIYRTLNDLLYHTVYIDVYILQFHKCNCMCLWMRSLFVWIETKNDSFAIYIGRISIKKSMFQPQQQYERGASRNIFIKPRFGYPSSFPWFGCSIEMVEYFTKIFNGVTSS